MENASKALLIAGAILIVILLIGVGMMVFNGAQTSIEGSLDTMTSQEIQSFNSQFSSYEGSVKGSAVRSLIQKVIASNASNTYNRVINLKEGATAKTSLDSSSTKDDIANAGQVMSQYAASLTTTSKYVVKFDFNADGTINTIIIN